MEYGKGFFSGYELPRCVTHINLVLIPNKGVVDNFGDLRHITVSTFAKKIISRQSTRGVHGAT